MLEAGGTMSDTALVVMARYPEKGKIKTRLAQSIGDENAQRLYYAFLTDLAQKFAGGDWRKAVGESWGTRATQASPPFPSSAPAPTGNGVPCPVQGKPPGESRGGWGGGGGCDLYWAFTPAGVDFHRFVAMLTALDAASCRSFPQQGAELGARLHHVFRTMYARNLQKTIVIASDSPHISQAVVSQAREALDSTDLVLGPADDGGYYLIAMREPHDVFSDIPMSTQHVLQMTVDKARDQGLSVQLLEPLFDVDELPDLVRLAHLLGREQALAPATAACLAQIIPAHFLKEIV
jgi:uncharacterized protein